jgi:hypothetical protein
MFGKFLVSKAPRGGARRRTMARRLTLERLEDRLTPAPFTPGNLVLVRVGTGAGALTGSATETFLDEYTTAGMPAGNSVALPTDAGNALTLSGTGTTEGYLTGSVDGHSLTLGGYNATPGNPTFDSANPVSRVIGLVAPDGTLDTSTQFPQDDAGTIRSAASVDGGGFWVATSNFVRYVPFGNSGTSSTVLSSLVQSPTVAEIFPPTGLSQTSQLYIDGGAGAQSNGFPAIDSPATVGAGLPVTGGQNVVVPAEFPTTSQMGQFPTSNQFVFSPDGNTVFIADGRTNGAGGLLTYRRSSSAGLYQRVPGLSVTFPTTGLRGLVADFTSVGGHVILYGTTTEASANHLMKFDDNGSTTTATDLATAPANEVFRGVAFTPTVPGLTGSIVTLAVDTSTGTTYGTEPTLRATVTGTGGPIPTGWVSFRLDGPGGAEVGAAPVVNGVAALQATTNLPAGSDNVVAVYTGDTSYAGSNSDAQPVTVSQAPTATAVSFSANPVGTNAPVTLTATVSVTNAQANGYGVQPTGTVSFLADGVALGSDADLTPSIVNQGGQPVLLYQATLTTSFATRGVRNITATYNGDPNYAGVTSPAQPLSVVFSTITTVTTSDPDPLASAGVTVTLTATVTSDGGTPTGSVTFYDDLLRVGTPATLVGGVASVTINTSSVQAPRGQADVLTPGLHSVTAIYTPDPGSSGTFFGSQGVYEQAVAADPFGAGDLFVFRVGDGTTSIIAPPGSPYAGTASIGNTIFVDEYTAPDPMTGRSTLVQSIILPTADGTLTDLYDQRAVHAVVADGQQSATGQLSLSGDGQYLFLTGFDSNPLPIATAPELHYVNTTSRAVARIAPDGTVQTIGFVSGAITGADSPAVQTGGNINGVYSPDGNQFYVAGFNGVDYFAGFAPSADLQSFDARITLTNFTVVGLEQSGGNLFAVGGSGAARTVGQVGTGLPTMPASITTIPGFPGSSDTTSPFPIDAYFTHLDGPGAPDGINTLYVADDGVSFSRGTITKWSFDGTNWNLTDTIQADGTTVVSFYWLAGQTAGNTVTLYVTYGQGGNANMGRGDLYRLIDGAGYGQQFAAGTMATTVASVNDTSLENFRGVAFAPVAPPTAPRTSGTNSSVVGSNVTFTGAVSGTSTGAVHFHDGSDSIDRLPAGAHSLSASYAGLVVGRYGSWDVWTQTVLDSGSPWAVRRHAAAAADGALFGLGSDAEEWARS